MLSFNPRYYAALDLAAVLFAFCIPTLSFSNRVHLSPGTQYHQQLLDFVCRYLADRSVLDQAIRL
jgi:hypothetical protein